MVYDMQCSLGVIRCVCDSRKCLSETTGCPGHTKQHVSIELGVQGGCVGTDDIMTSDCAVFQLLCFMMAGRWVAHSFL